MARINKCLWDWVVYSPMSPFLIQDQCVLGVPAGELVPLMSSWMGGL